MKIKCEFCGNMMNDTVEVCPHCGAPNARVRRASGDQPVTIEQLKQWYESKGLPPYEVTRFFIGINYQKPKAFGIYFDENTGHYIVYKNKDNGSRAIRYEGTDEAYAVNELFQRLKQEITQQKMANANKRAEEAAGNQSLACKASDLLLKILRRGLLILIGGSVLFMLLGVLLTWNDPDYGYYLFDGVSYYCSDTYFDGSNWFRYDSDDGAWSAPLTNNVLPDELEKKRTAKEYFQVSDWNITLTCPDFKQSVYGQDLLNGFYIKDGYYRSGDQFFYHLPEDYNRGWYQFGTEWESVYYSSLPQALQHTSTAAEQFISREYSSDIEAEDFSQTLIYQDYIAPSTVLKGYYQVEDLTLYHNQAYYDTGWYAYLDDEWTPISADALPQSLQHPSLIEDFYFTPTWDSSTQFTDFEDSPYYEQEKDNWNGYDSDSDFNWDSGDSWDSGDTDWGSDW